MVSHDCAVGANGQLLDASEINWYNDADDDKPIPKTLTDAAGAQPKRQPSATTLDSFFSDIPPAEVVAGSRRSARASRPSTRLVDPNNSVDLKHKNVPGLNLPRHRARRGIIDSDGEATEPEGAKTDGVSDHGQSDEDEGPKAAYEYTKSLGDTDRDARRVTSKEERTADIRTVFTCVEHVNTDTGKKVSGHYCTVCRDKGLSSRSYFFAGSVSSLRTHVARHKDHYKIYKECCTSQNIPINDRAIPPSELQLGLSRQSTLDGSFESHPRVPPFTTHGLLDYMVELVVSEDKAFQLVDKSSFRHLLVYLHPSLSDQEIPHRQKLRKEILARAEVAKAKVKAALQDAKGQISFTFDTWTSDSGNPYVSVTAHYIASSKEQPHEWQLKLEQLAFTSLEGNHSGANMATILVRTLDRYGIRSKAGWFMADNASNNDTALRELGIIIDPNQDRWYAGQRRVRCMEHSLHLAARHFITMIAPTPAADITKDYKYDSGDDDNATCGVAGALGKALALVHQIRKSPQACAFFRQTCREAEVPELELVQFVRTRWASMFAFLDRLLVLQKAVSRFTQLADISENVPDLVNKKYMDFRLSKLEWEQLKLMHEVLQEPANAQQSFSSSHEPTVWRTIPILEFLQESWENMAAHPKFSELKDGIFARLENLKKWYRKTDDTDVYFISLALDPNWKFAYAEEKWDPEFFNIGVRRLESVFDNYAAQMPTVLKESPAPPIAGSLSHSAISTSNVQYGYSWMRAAVDARKAAASANLELS